MSEIEKHDVVVSILGPVPDWCEGEIVRCRDCKHYREHKWFEVVVGTPLGTDISDVCMLFADGCKVEPDGYCSWGERDD